MVPLKLSAVKPDFESLLLQLQLYLQATGSWVDLQTSSTGQTILESIAAVGAYNQFAIESAARETTLTTAVRDSSVYAITRMLGVRIHRKSPSSVSAQIYRKDASLAETIAVFTQFSVNGTNFFNRYPLMFSQGSLQAAERLYYGTPVSVPDNRSFQLSPSIISQLRITTGEQFTVQLNSGLSEGQIRTFEYLGGNVGNNMFRLLTGEATLLDLTTAVRLSVMRSTLQLHEGVVLEETFTSDGSDFQQFYLSKKAFAASDVDVKVYVYDETSAAFIKWEPTTDGLWVSDAYDQVYFDSTSGEGEAIITFGDGITGAKPKLGTEIRIKYIETSGAKANNGLTNLAVTMPSANSVNGSTVTVISGGADEKPANYYRTMAPLIFKARNRGITKSDYKAVALDYPGIISVSVQTQRDVAPNDLRWMNQIQICLLPSAEGVYALSSAEWLNFMTYMDDHKHAAVNILSKDPSLQTCAIDITLALKTQYVSSSATPEAEAAIRALFKRQSDTLGRRVTVSDITRAAMVKGVDYVVVNSCNFTGSPGIADLVPVDNTHFLEAGVVVINTKYSEREIY